VCNINEIIIMIIMKMKIMILMNNNNINEIKWLIILIIKWNNEIMIMNDINVY